MSHLERQAALVVLVNPFHRVLAISRDRDTSDWGFPGGTAEPAFDATIADTAFRELREETGVVAAEISMLDTARSGSHLVTTFMAESVAIWPPFFRSVPFEGHVQWVEPKVLTAPTCTYRAHARKILNKVGLL